MAFCLRIQAELEEKLGPLVLKRLFYHVGNGGIKKDTLKKMSYSANMDVFPTYSECDQGKENLQGTLERMLEEWYDKTVCLLPPSEALEELLRILKVTCPASVFVDMKTLSEGESPQQDMETDGVRPRLITRILDIKHHMFFYRKKTRGEGTTTIVNHIVGNQNSISGGSISFGNHIVSADRIFAVVGLVGAMLLLFLLLGMFSKAVFPEQSSLSASFSPEGHYETELANLWGQDTLNQLQKYVKDGDITGQNIRAMAQRMGVLRVYQENYQRMDIMDTFALMLEEWYKNDLPRHDPGQAKAQLVDVLRSSRLDKSVVGRIQTLCQ